MAKFGVVALTETLRVELVNEQSAISASVLCPGAINTRIVESARNRDAASADTHSASAEEQAFQDGAGKLLARGMAPAEVADKVVNAFRNDEFWILTHAEWKDVLAERVRELIESNQLHRGFGG